MNRTISPRPFPRARAALPGSLVLGLVGAGVVLVPSAALAEEGVHSSYNVGCTIHPDQGQASGDDPAGVAFDGERNDLTASPATHTITGSSLSTYPGAGSGFTGEDCGVSGGYSDRLTVGAGTSGLAAGDEVSVQVTVHLDAAQAEEWGADPFQIRADYTARASITSMDDCDWAGEGFSCETPLRFSADHDHYVYWSPDDGWHVGDYVYAQAQRDHRFETNGSGGDAEGADNYVDEDGDVCEPFPCTGAVPGHAPHPETYTATAVLVVGDRYDIEGYLNIFTQAYDSLAARGSVSVEDFSLTITPLTAGIDLAYASEGGTADTTPPVISGAEDVTVTSSDGSPVPVGFAVTATDDVDGTVPVTCTPASGSPFPVGTTTVTCQATDTAGNTGVAGFDVTVQAGPTVQLGASLAGLSVHHGIKNALRSKYDAAVAAFAADRDEAGCGALQAMSRQIAAQSGKKIGAADAATLSALVAAARAEHGC